MGMRRGLLLLLVITFMGRIYAQMLEDFYSVTDPNFEAIYEQTVAVKVTETFTTTQGLYTHDCFGEPCEASVTIQSANNDTDKDTQANLSPAGDAFDTVIKAKNASVEDEVHPEKQFEHLQAQLEKSGSLNDSIRAVVMEIQSLIPPEEIKAKLPDQLRALVDAVGDHYSMEQWSSVTAAADREHATLMLSQGIPLLMTLLAVTKRSVERGLMEDATRLELDTAYKVVDSTKKLLGDATARAEEAERAILQAKLQIHKAEEAAHLNEQRTKTSEATLEKAREQLEVVEVNKSLVEADKASLKEENGKLKGEVARLTAQVIRVENSKNKIIQNLADMITKVE